MRRILLATDFSDGARLALDRAVRLASESGASLNVLYAAPEAAGRENALHARLLDEAHQAAARNGARTVEIRSVISVLDPRQAILRRAEKLGADLIILGGHGKPRFRDAIFGTTATHVVKHSPLPVLIVQTDPSSPYLKLMVAADRPEGAERLVESALSVAPAAEVFAVHAFRASFIETLGGNDMLEDRAAREVAALQAALQPVGKAHPQALLSAHRHVVADQGDAVTVLMDEAEQLVPDLVVMGTRHRDSFLGSRAVDACFWCPADLLIVPEPAPALVPADA